VLRAILKILSQALIAFNNWTLKKAGKDEQRVAVLTENNEATSDSNRIANEVSSSSSDNLVGRL